MLLATISTGHQQLQKSTLPLNATNFLSGRACVKSNITSNNKDSISSNNFVIMSSSLDVPTTSTATVSPVGNANITNSNNLQCSSNNNIASQKYETPYGGNITSPCNSDVNKSQNLDDTNINNKNKNKGSNGVNLAVMDSASRSERESLSNISSNSLIRQSSTSTNSCSVQFNESPPNADSSSSSSNTSHLNNDNNKSNEEEKLGNNQNPKNNVTIKEEERDKTTSSSSTTSSTPGNAATNISSNQTSISGHKSGMPPIVKDEKDLIKKEETPLSPPNMSPVGFGSIVGTQINECVDNPTSMTNKTTDSATLSDKRMNSTGNVCNDNEESSLNQSNVGRIVPCSGANLNLINNSLNTSANLLNSKSSLDGFCSDPSTTTSVCPNTPSTNCNIPLNASFILNNLSSSNDSPQGSGGANIISGGSGGMSNCMEYMQQQNHIFVFSTQLANKGAEAVLGGQFPTIIAYHCTQPATKSFFEDFFLKNPMKMTKLQRQNTLNIIGGLQNAGGPGSGGQPPWLAANCNSMGKVSHKLPLNKTETITSSASTSIGAGVLNESDMMCWDQTRSVIGSPAGDSANAMKIIENSENAGNAAKSACNNLSNEENGGIPSLQGVKVPDENLTPQQRQHREEQLAKLKKMNQFLFPENGSSDFHSQTPENNPMTAGKIQVPPEALAGGMPGNAVQLMNMQSANIGNKLSAAAIRNISGNLMNHTKSGSSNSQLDNMPNLGEDIMMSNDIMGSSGCGPNDMAVIPTSLKQGCMPNMNSNSGMGANGGRGLLNASSANLNIMNSSGPMGMQPGGLINDSNNAMMGNNADILSSFNSNHCPSSVSEGGSGGAMMGSHKNMNAPLNLPSDMNTAVNVSQMEWSKLHHHLYEERLKNNNPNPNGIPTEISGSGTTGCQQTLTRCNSTGIGGAGSISHRTNTNANANNRGNQGPPPPYHPTQRSASVPIATQSPNPSSPNNPTSNMSLPSPRASNTMGGALSTTTSPSMDVTSASSASTISTNSTMTTTTAVSGGTPDATSNKIAFSQQGSPTTGSGAGNPNRNRSSVNNLNSNPTTPLSHVSPKDIDSKSMNTTPTPDHKSNRSITQRSRSPLLSDIPNNNTMEPRFPSPGLNFTTTGAAVANTQNLPISFKNQNSSLDQRRNLQQVPPQFCRRTDNMPLNPNSNRHNHTKMTNSFDPISSLAQMSQQLTGGGVGLNSSGMGNSPNNMGGLMGAPGGVNDVNMNGLMSGPVMGGPTLDPSIDHGSNMGISGLGGGPGSVTGPFGPGNCNLMGGNSGPICQRLLSPKMCGPNMSGGFNPNQIPGMGMRDGPSGFPGMMPNHRMMNHRMSANFGNFNVSPNIQVKASTPNTIQYMPVRPQNSSSNNMRVPPSLEFLQRYANPQMMGNSITGGGPGSVASPSDIPTMNGPNDLNKMPNTNNMGVNSNVMNQMNFFGNCNQMSAMGNMGQSVGGGGGDQDELQNAAMMSNHDPMSIPGPHAPMLRGMRPMRQGGLQAGGGISSGSRMQHPSMGNILPNGLGNSPFPGNDSETLDCNDPTNVMFNNPAAAGLCPQKNNKTHTIGMSHGPSNLNPNNAGNVSLPNNNSINDQNPSNPMQNSVMMGPNNSLLNSNMSSSNNGGPLSGPGNMDYKTFVGPTSNDLKYAQQYHSFQQQLYATSTRNQQPGGGQQQSPNAMSPNSNPNAGFFVNK